MANELQTKLDTILEDKNTNLYKLTIDTLEQYQKEDSDTSKSI